MRIALAAFLLALSFLETSYSADLQARDGTAAASDAKQSCPPLKTKTKPPLEKPSSPPGAQQHPVIQVCAPTFTATTATVPESANVPNLTTTIATAATPSSLGASSATSSAATAEQSESFRFKIKDVLEADVKTGSRWLIWTLVLAFGVFAVTMVLTAKSVVTTSAATWILIPVGVFILGALIAFSIPKLTSPGVESSTIDRLYELYNKTLREEVIPTSVMDVARIQHQITQLTQALREQDGQIAMIKDTLLRSQSEKLSSNAFLYLAAGASIGALAAAFLINRRSTQVSAKRFAADPNGSDLSSLNPKSGNGLDLPLLAIYELEDHLSVLRINVDKTYTFLQDEKITEIPNPQALLVSLNAVRQQLEGGLAVETAHAGATPLSQTQFRIKHDVKSYEFHDLRKALGELDDVLSSRYEVDLKSWRKHTLKALSRGRKALVALCEPIETEEASEPAIASTGDA